MTLRCLGVVVLAALAALAAAPAAGGAPPPLPSFAYTYGVAQVRVTMTQHWDGSGPLPGDTYDGTETHVARRQLGSSERRAVGGVNYLRGRRASSGGGLAVPVEVSVVREEKVTRAATQGGAERCAISPLTSNETLRLRLSVVPQSRAVRVEVKVPAWYVSLGVSGCEAPTAVDPLTARHEIPASQFSARRFVIVLSDRRVTKVTDTADSRRRLTSTLTWNVRLTLVRLAGYPARPIP